jgi:hypothetical protein
MLIHFKKKKNKIKKSPPNNVNCVNFCPRFGIKKRPRLVGISELLFRDVIAFRLCT